MSPASRNLKMVLLKFHSNFHQILAVLNNISNIYLETLLFITMMLKYQKEILIIMHNKGVFFLQKNEFILH